MFLRHYYNNYFQRQGLLSSIWYKGLIWDFKFCGYLSTLSSAYYNLNLQGSCQPENQPFCVQYTAEYHRRNMVCSLAEA